MVGFLLMSRPSGLYVPERVSAYLWVQNALGVFAAGGLGGLLLLQKQDKQKSEEDLGNQLQGERRAVGDLKQQVCI